MRHPFWEISLLNKVIAPKFAYKAKKKIAKRFALCAHSPSPPLNVGDLGGLKSVWGP